MSEIQFPEAKALTYDTQFNLKIEESLALSIDEIKEHAKRVSKKDVNETIRIQLRKIVQEYWAQNQKESA